MNLSDYVAAWHTAGRFDGAAAVVRQGEVLMRQGFGMARHELGTPNMPQTLFRIGSITKSFVAATVLRLASQGRLDVEATVAVYLPEYRHAGQMTVHQLLSQTAGVPDHTSFAEYSTRERVTPAMLMERLNQRELLYPPGQGVNYSNSHYFLVARIIEAVTGDDLASVIRREVLEPSGLVSTGFCTTDEGIACGYSFSGEGRVLAEPFDMSGAYGSGNMYSSLDDLVRWVQLFLRHRPALTPYAHIPHMQGWYGYGCFLSDGVVSMSGLICGYTCKVAHHQEQDLTVVLLSNNDAMPLQRLARGLMAGGTGVMIKPEPAQVPLPDVTGTYRCPYTGGSFEITREQGRLYVDRLFAQTYRRERFALYPVSPAELACEVCDSRFIFSDDGRVIYSFDVFDIPYQAV